MAVRDLTYYTGRERDEHRTVFVQVVSARWRTFRRGLIGAVIGGILAGIFSLLLGPWALVLIPVGAATMIWALERRKDDRLSVSPLAAIDAHAAARTGRGLRGRRQVNTVVGRVLIAGEEPAAGDIAELIPLIVPNEREDRTPQLHSGDDALFAAPVAQMSMRATIPVGCLAPSSEEAVRSAE